MGPVQASRGRCLLMVGSCIRLVGESDLEKAVGNQQGRGNR